MWFIDKRIQVICDELKKLMTVKNMPMENILYKEGRFSTRQRQKMTVHSGKISSRRQ